MIGSEDFAASHYMGSLRMPPEGALQGAWKRRAWGLAIALADEGHFVWEDLRQALLSERGATSEEDGWLHCQRWLNALTRVVRDAGLVDVGVLAELGHWANQAAADCDE